LQLEVLKLARNAFTEKELRNLKARFGIMGQKRITYLLGAGASAQTVLIVDQMPGKISEVIALLDLEKVASLVSDTEILVVIGYSFPNFNREVDQLLFDAMKKRLRKVYIQVPEGDFETRKFKLRQYFGVETRRYNMPRLFSGERNIEEVEEETIFPAIGTDEFFLPPEF